jgi:hypothetical protein
MAQYKETVSVQNKRHAVIEIFTAKNILLIDIHYFMEVVYGVNNVDIGVVQCWAGRVHDANLESCACDGFPKCSLRN